MKLRRSIRNNQGIMVKILLVRYSHICKRNNAYIPLNAQISKDVAFPHGISGVFISQGARIGNGCTIFHHVTIGSNTLKESEGFGAPVIENDVLVGAGATIIGNVHVGSGARVGANATVVKDCPANATVVASNARVIMHEEKRKNMFVKYKTNRL